MDKVVIVTEEELELLRLLTEQYIEALESYEKNFGQKTETENEKVLLEKLKKAEVN